jgi:hypothetical protein
VSDPGWRRSFPGLVGIYAIVPAVRHRLTDRSTTSLVMVRTVFLAVVVHLLGFGVLAALFLADGEPDGR